MSTLRCLRTCWTGQNLIKSCSYLNTGKFSSLTGGIQNCEYNCSKLIKINSNSNRLPYQGSFLTSSRFRLLSAGSGSVQKRADKVAVPEEEEWITVYRFPYIHYARVLQKFKIYHSTFCGGVVIPVSAMAYFLGSIGEPLFQFLFGMSAFSGIVLYFMGNLVQDLIGIIYVNKEDPELVKVSRMTFWGNRIDEVFSRSDFVPFLDLQDGLNDVYVKLQLYSEDERRMKLSLKYGTVYEPDLLFNVFGNVPDIKVKRKDAQEEEGKQGKAASKSN